MAHIETAIQNRKYKHLSSFERGEISALHRGGHPNREIIRLIRRVHQIIANELKRGTTTQLKMGREVCTAYFPEIGQTVYKQNRKNVVQKNTLLVAMECIDYACERILDEN